MSAQIDGPVTAVEPVEPADGTAEDGDEEGAARAAEDAAEGEDEGEDEEGDDDQMAEPMVWAMEQLTKEQSAPMHDVLAELSKASVGTMTPLLQIRTLLAQTKRTPEELAKDAHSVEFVLGLVFCARPFKNFPQMDEEVEVSLRVEKAMQHLRHGRVADPGACKEAVEELKMDADALREVKEQSNFTNFERIEKNIVVLERFLQLWGKGKAKKVQKKISEHFDAGALWVAVVDYLDRLDRSLGKTFMERVFDDIDAGRVPEHSHLGQLLKVREGYTYKADAGVPKQHTRATRGAAAIGAATFVPDELPAGWEEPPLKRAGRPPAPPPQPSAAAAAKPLPVARAPPAPTGAMAVALAATDAEKEAAAGLQDMVGDGAAGPSGHAGDKGVIPLEVLLQNYNGADTKQRAKSKGKMSAAQKRKAALAFEDDSDDSGSDFEEGEDKARAATRELRQTVKDAGKATEDPLEAARAAARGAGRRIGGAAKVCARAHAHLHGCQCRARLAETKTPNCAGADLPRECRVRLRTTRMAGAPAAIATTRG